MLELKDFMPINFLKKEKFTGSHKGLRFRMEKLEENEYKKDEEERYPDMLFYWISYRKAGFNA